MQQETMTFPRTRQGLRDLDAAREAGLPVSSGPAPQPRAGVNVGDRERWLSAAGGGLLALFGLSRGSLAGLGLAAAGGALLYRGLSGHCHLYEALGRNTATGSNTPDGAEVVYRLS